MLINFVLNLKVLYHIVVSLQSKVAEVTGGDQPLMTAGVYR